MTDLITFLENNGKPDVYTGGNFHVMYRYLEIIGSPTTLNTSGQRSHNFGPSDYINNYTASLQKFIESLHMRQKSIWECCRIIGHKADACIIRGPKFLPPILRRNMNQFNSLHSEEPNEPTAPQRERNRRPPEAHFKYRTFPTNTSPVVFAIMGRLNYHHYQWRDN